MDSDGELAATQLFPSVADGLASAGLVPRFWAVVGTAGCASLAGFAEISTDRAEAF